MERFLFQRASQPPQTSQGHARPLLGIYDGKAIIETAFYNPLLFNNYLVLNKIACFLCNRLCEFPMTSSVRTDTLYDFLNDTILIIYSILLQKPISIKLQIFQNLFP